MTPRFVAGGNRRGPDCLGVDGSAFARAALRTPKSHSEGPTCPLPEESLRTGEPETVSGRART